MEKLASIVVRVALMLGIVAGLVALGTLFYLAVPGGQPKEDCAPREPRMPIEGLQMGQYVEIEAAPAACGLDLPPDASYEVELSVTHSVIDQHQKFIIPVNPGGSFASRLPIDPRNTSGSVTVRIYATAYDQSRVCHDGEASCAVTLWELGVVVD